MCAWVIKLDIPQNASFSDEEEDCDDFLLENKERLREAVDERDEMGRTALMIACTMDDGDIVDLLTARGCADVDALDLQSRTPIYYALSTSNYHTQKYIHTLLASGADLDTKFPSMKMGGYFHLMACMGKMDRMIQFCNAIECDIKDKQDEGCELDVSSLHSIRQTFTIFHVDEDGRNPFHIAALVNHPAHDEFCKAVDRYISPGRGKAFTTELMFEKDRYGLQPAHLACRLGNAQFIMSACSVLQDASVLLEKFGVHEETCVHMACASGNLDLVKYIANNVAPECVDSEEDSPSSPLQIACMYGCTSVVEYLLTDKQVSYRANDRNGMRPIHHAANYAHADTINTLLEHNPKMVTLTDFSNRTPLHIACAAERLELQPRVDTVKLLLKRGANVQALDKWKKTPLLYAAGRKRALLEQDPADKGLTSYYIIQELQQAESNLFHVDGKGRTVLHYLAGSHDWKALDSFEELIAQVETTFDLKQEVNKKDFRGVAPLHLAAYFHSRDCKRTVDMLVSKLGAELETPDEEEERTPLHWACINNNSVAVNALLVHGADITAKDSQGRHSLMACLETPRKTNRVCS